MLNNNKVLEQFYDAIDLAIKQAGSINKLAKITGIGQTTISSWLSKEKKSFPSIDKVATILDYLGCTLNYQNFDKQKVSENYCSSCQRFQNELLDLHRENRRLWQENKDLHEVNKAKVFN